MSSLLCNKCRHPYIPSIMYGDVCPHCHYDNSMIDISQGKVVMNSFAPMPKVGEKDQEVLADGGTQFSTGAVRSADKNDVMYHLICPIGMRRMAETMKEGFDKYGAYNWERGMPIGDLLNHAIAHIYAFLSGVPSVDSKTGKIEDDLAHAAWNLFAAMRMEEKHPELDHQLRFKLSGVSIETQPINPPNDQRTT